MYICEYELGAYLELLSKDGRLVSALVLNKRDLLEGLVTSELSADVSHLWYESGDELSAYKYIKLSPTHLPFILHLYPHSTLTLLLCGAGGALYFFLHLPMRAFTELSLLLL